MRLVFTHSSPDFEDAVRAVCQGALFRPGAFTALGTAAYIALGQEHVDAYDRRFPGLRVRLAARLRHIPLHPGGAMYLPVTYDSWVVLVDGARALGAGLEAADALCVGTAVCPSFQVADGGWAADGLGLGRAYQRWQDRIVLKDGGPEESPAHDVVAGRAGADRPARDAVGRADDASGAPGAGCPGEPGN